MNFHEVLKAGGGLLVLLLFIPMLAAAVKDNGAGQSFAMWLLWTALDTILTVSVFQQHGNYLVPLGFALGDAGMTWLLWHQGRMAWGKFESVILLLVIGCLAGWKLGGNPVAIVAATLGICIAGVPGLVELWNNPRRNVGHIWAAYTLANGLSFWGGTAMTLEERFAPGAFAGYSLLMFLAGRRRVERDEKRNKNVACEFPEPQ